MTAVESIPLLHLGRHPDRDLQHALATGAVGVLPAGASWPEEPRHVGVAYDGTPAAEAALAVGFELAARHSAALTLYWAVPRPSSEDPPGADTGGLQLRDRAYELLDAAAERAPEGVNPERRVLYGESAAHTIAAEADGIVDLLVAGSRQISGWRRALLGSFSRALLEIAGFPIVIVPAPAP